MELNLQTYQELAKEYLQYQLAFYPIQLDCSLELQMAMMQSHQSNTDTMLSLRKIAMLKNVNDIYCLSRSMFESTINMGLLITGKINEGAKRFLEFQYVEAYKIYDHLNQVEPDLTSKVYESEEIEVIIARRKAFVSKYGNIGDWCGLNLVERVRLVDNNFPSTCSNLKFYEYLYCQVYRKGSGAIHRTSLGLGRSMIWRSSGVRNMEFVEPSPSQKHLVFACIHSLITYLSSIRFLGYALKDDTIESYYQKETSRIIAGKE
jgi:hypothetical protein